MKILFKENNFIFSLKLLIECPTQRFLQYNLTLFDASNFIFFHEKFITKLHFYEKNIFSYFYTYNFSKSKPL